MILKFVKNEIHIREDIKYYFADFVRKGGTPHPLLRTAIFQKKNTDLGGTLPPPFTDILPRTFLQKG